MGGLFSFGFARITTEGETTNIIHSGQVAGTRWGFRHGKAVGRRIIYDLTMAAFCIHDPVFLVALRNKRNISRETYRTGHAAPGHGHKYRDNHHEPNSTMSNSTLCAIDTASTRSHQQTSRSGRPPEYSLTQAVAGKCRYGISRLNSAKRMGAGVHMHDIERLKQPPHQPARRTSQNSQARVVELSAVGWCERTRAGGVIKW
ncbi:hypothetical protein GE09DRAFT_503502 [Coniochaeta sp. 2T2.1]|nr:hypothetical protein GE09DRAFT_503502 [Coniochaeta sp. 2T2.1]